MAAGRPRRDADAGHPDDLEERFWRPIEAQATLEVLRDDPGFLADPGTPSGDVRRPRRRPCPRRRRRTRAAAGHDRRGPAARGPSARRQFVEAYGVAAAYLHDIGMVDMTRSAGGCTRCSPRTQRSVRSRPTGRPPPRARPGPATGWTRSPLGAVRDAARDRRPRDAQPDGRPQQVGGPRRRARRPGRPSGDSCSAWSSRASTRIEPPNGPAAPTPPDPVDANTAGYADPTQRSPGSTADDGPQAGLADDVVDACGRSSRGRAAAAGDGAPDVWRVRGVHGRARPPAVCTLRPASGDAAYVITYDDPRGAGEANIRVAFVTPRGTCASRSTAAPSAARRPRGGLRGASRTWSMTSRRTSSRRSAAPRRRRPADPDALRRRHPDPARAARRSARFADEVAALVAERDPGLAGRLVTVADIEGAAPEERRPVLRGRAPRCAGRGRRAPSAAGRARRRTSGIDRVAAFAEVRRATIRGGRGAGRPGSPPSFVYVPTGPGLVVRPDGGYAPSPLPPWVPVGTTGVIRRAERNSEIVAAVTSR